MDLKKFKEEALRTESVKDVIITDAAMFENLQSSFVAIADCMDLIKKNVFYGKDIDIERFRSNLEYTIGTLQSLSQDVSEDVNFTDNLTEQKIDPREFHAAIGMATESAELLELVRLNVKHMDTVSCADEMGDWNWYSTIMLDAKQLDAETQILDPVIAKLRKRFPDKFDSRLAINRDKLAERRETENTLDNASND